MLKSVSIRTGYDTCIPKQAELAKCFKLRTKFISGNITANTIQDTKLYKRNNNVYTSNDCTNYRGYFQSYLYFDDIRDIILDEYTFKDHIISEANHNTVSIHIRRTDYLKSKNHVIQPLDYYVRAMDIISQSVKNAVYMVFSDDIDWCKNNLTGSNIVYSNNNQYVDLCSMSLCQHNIISSSTFGWWGAWLNRNKNKIVIAPKKWYANVDTTELLPPSWIIL